MITDRKKQIFLAKANGDVDKLYLQDVRKAVKKKHRLEDEVAILRKMLKRAFDLIVELHGSEISDSVIEEFRIYFDDVELIKKELKEELGIE